MNSEVACIVIAHQKRKALLYDRTIQNVTEQGFDEMICVGDWEEDGTFIAPWRYVRVGPIQRTTLDALLKRDAGTLAARADTLVYLNDDHTPAPNFLRELREVLAEPWDVLVPNRYTMRLVSDPEPDDFQARKKERILLNNGEADGYCGGHAGVFRRAVVESWPWMTWAWATSTPLLWDRDSSYIHRAQGVRYVWRPRTEIAVEDLEPEREPWK